MPRLRAVLIVAAFLAITALGMPVQWLLLKLGSRAARTFPNRYHRVVAALFGIHINVVGRPVTGEGVLMVANHTSYLDIPCIYAAIPQPIRFLAKISLFKIPIFGWALGRAGFIPIDRKNRRTAVKSFDLAAARIRKGNTIVVFPEEGRSATREMRPFQRGGFLLAIKSEQPIVPLAIDGMFDVLPVGASRVKPGPVVVRVGTPIPTADVTVREKERLAQESRAQILAMLGAAAPS